MAKRPNPGDVFCCYLNKEGLKGYGRVIDYLGPRKRIPCIELYRLPPRVEKYTLEEISQARVLVRVEGAVQDWEYIGHIPVNPEELPQYYGHGGERLHCLRLRVIPKPMKSSFACINGWTTFQEDLTILILVW